MGEIAKEMPKNREVTDINETRAPESEAPEVKAPEIKPKSGITPEQAQHIYEKIVGNDAVEGNDAGRSGEADEDGDVLKDIYDCDTDDFDFGDLELDEEELKNILKYFKPEVWEKLDIYDKRAVIIAFTGYLAKVLDLKNPPRVVFYYGPHYDCGAYDRASNTIRININRLDEPQMAINTVAHEARHAYQHQCAENPQTRQDKLYAYNFDHYIRPVVVDGKWVGFEEYENQLVEAEANAFGRLFQEKIGA